MKIIIGIGQLEGEGKPNPLLKEMDKDGTLRKLVEIFQNEKQLNKQIIVYAACSIGRLFKATELPQEFGQSIIINLLKDLSLLADRNLSDQSLFTLICLAECESIKMSSKPSAVQPSGSKPLCKPAGSQPSGGTQIVSNGAPVPTNKTLIDDGGGGGGGRRNFNT
ncbi:MAG: hypothetical protein EZS28_033883 [Streblomastix strix]|uniref:Uncharacterized protein n=1 Tax=Streblomastix strix TaxID=222440 RepID=A0A5J4UKL1_9EUKA|nr:MAG: hypothetical protein EZS28_033883 [Streblomastix strix]